MLFCLISLKLLSTYVIGEDNITTAIANWLNDVNNQTYQTFYSKYSEQVDDQHVEKSKLVFECHIKTVVLSEMFNIYEKAQLF